MRVGIAIRMRSIVCLLLVALAVAQPALAAPAMTPVKPVPPVPAPATPAATAAAPAALPAAPAVPATAPSAAAPAVPEENRPIAKFDVFNLGDLMGLWFAIGHASVPDQVKHFQTCACNTAGFFVPQNYTMGRHGAKRVGELVSEFQCFNKTTMSPVRLYTRFRLIPNTGDLDVLYTRNIPGIPPELNMVRRERHELVKLLAFVDDKTYVIFQVPATGRIWIMARDINLPAGKFDQLVQILLKRLPNLKKEDIIEIKPNVEECKNLYKQYMKLHGDAADGERLRSGMESSLPRTYPNVPMHEQNVPVQRLTDAMEGVDAQYPFDDAEGDVDGMSIADDEGMWYF